MNLMLHGIGGLEGEPIEVNDSLKADPGQRFDIVLTNPPFGKKSSFTVVGENGEASKEREPDGRWRDYAYDDLVARDKANLDIFWLKDDSLEDSDNLPPPEVIAQEMIEDLEAALEQLRAIAGDLEKSREQGPKEAKAS